MNYLKKLNLTREPFSNTPDPQLFYPSRQHRVCLQKLEIAIRLRRGLNVVVGEVGSGKTTLCRQLIRMMSKDETIIAHLILDPSFNSPLEFITTIAELLDGFRPEPGASELVIKEAIKNYLFRLGVDEDKTVLLIVDEGQKLPSFGLEILRELLNFETNDNKLIQIVIFAQKEFETAIKKHVNFTDRINLFHILGPLNFQETRAMIDYRITQSSDNMRASDIFTFWAMWAVYRFSRGYPRKIINICHLSILKALVEEQSRIHWLTVHACSKKTAFTPITWKKHYHLAAALAVLAAALILTWPYLMEQKKKLPVMTGPAAVASTTRPSKPPGSQTRETAAVLTSASSGPITAAGPLAAAASAATAGDSSPPVRTGQSAASPDSAPTAWADDTPEVVNGLEPASPEAVPDSPLIRGNILVKAMSAVAVSRPSSDTFTDPALLELTPNAPGKIGKNMLGRVPIQSGETLYNLITVIYGGYRSQYMDAVLQANPGIKNPGLVNENKIINFPIITEARYPSPDKVNAEVIGQRNTLKACFQLMRSHGDYFRQLRVIPRITAGQLSGFSVIKLKSGSEPKSSPKKKRWPPPLKQLASEK